MSWMFALVACKVVDAPESLEELATFTFVNLEERQAVVDEAADGLVQVIESDAGVLADDGYRVNAITSVELAAVGIEKELDEDGVTGAAGEVRMVSSLAEVAGVVTLPDLAPVFSRTTRYQVTLDEGSDRACFLARDCDRMGQAGTRENDQPFPIGQTKQDFTQLFRWAETSDGRDVLLFRTLVPDETETSANIVNLEQNYVIAAIWESTDGTARVEVNWVDANVIGIDFPDSLALNEVVKAMQTQAEEIDAFVQGQ